MRASLLLISICLAASGQGMVESAAAAGAAATATAPSRNVAKSVSGLADKLNEVLQGAADQSSDGAARQAARSTTTKGTALPAPKPAAKVEDPMGIEAGMTDEEVLRRFGPPNLQVTGDDGKSFLYSGKSGKVRVQIQDGKVLSVEKTMA